MRRAAALGRSLLLAIGFTSILPVPMVRLRTGDYARAVAWFPACGLILGGLLAIADASMPASWPPLLRAVLLVSLLAWLTRALHLDGVVDTFDGMGGGWGDRERTLTIMRDPRAGSFGVVAVVLLLAAKATALAVLVGAGDARALLLFPLAGRTAGALLPSLFESARPDGLGRLMIARSPLAAIAAAVGIGGGLAALIGGTPRVGIAMGVAAAVALLLAWRWSRVLRGLTGDTYGAAIEFAEVAFLLALV